MKEYNFRKGDLNDAEALKMLALHSWSRFRNDLTTEHWGQLYTILKDSNTYLQLLETADCVICEASDQKISGMSFLVPHGYPTNIYPENWCYIRFLTVSPEHGGKGIGRYLTQQCLDLAKQKGEHTIALHTSEMMQNARRLYEHMGFEIVRELPKRFGKRYWLYKQPL